MLVSAFLGVIALGEARAQETTGVHGEGTVDAEALHAISVTWGRDALDGVLPELLLSGNGRPVAEAVLTFRVSFADRLTSWTLEPVRIDSDTSVDVAVDVPSEAHWADEQDNFLTDLEISVQSFDSDGRLVDTHSGPRLKLLWSDSQFTFLDPAQARALAPHGFAREAPPGGEELLAEEAALGNENIQFGPGL